MPHSPTLQLGRAPNTAQQNLRLTPSIFARQFYKLGVARTRSPVNRSACTPLCRARTVSERSRHGIPEHARKISVQDPSIVSTRSFELSASTVLEAPIPFAARQTYILINRLSALKGFVTRQLRELIIRWNSDS